MKRLIVSLASFYALANAQVIDNVKYVWQPGFRMVPELSMLSNYMYSDPGFSPVFIEDSGVYEKDDGDTLNKLDLSQVSYGLKLDWHTILFRQWFNSASIDFQMMQPNYGVAMTKYTDGTDEGNVINSEKAAASFHFRIEDVILHANHTWGSVLPYMGFGMDYYKIGGHLAYVNGSQRSTQIMYVPIGAFFQMSPMISAKMQVNIALNAKTKYAFQGDPAQSQSTDAESYNYTFSYDDSVEKQHGNNSSIGYAGSLFIRLPGFGNTSIEPYFQVWSLINKKGADDIFNIRWRSFGLRANMAF